MTASKLNREWDPFTLAEGIANSDLKDKAEKVIAQYNRKIKVFHPDLVLTGKVAIASAETHVFDQIKKPPFWASARPAQASARPGPASARLKIASKHLKHVLRMVLAAEAVRSATILKMNIGRRLRYSQIIGEKTWPKCPMVLGHLDLTRL